MIRPVWLVAAALPAFAQTTLNLSEDLVKLKIASSNMTPNQPTLDAGPLITAGVNYAVANKIQTVLADQGAYYFLSLSANASSPHLVLNNLNNITIDFQGSDLYLTHPVNLGIEASGTGLTLQNFTLDYAPLAYTQVQVVSVDPANFSVTYSVPSGWQDPSFLSTFGATSPTVTVFRRGYPVAGLTRMSVNLPPSGNTLTFLNPATTPSSTQVQFIDAGDTLVLSTAFNNTPLAVTGCTGCTFRNIMIYSGIVALQTYVGVQSTLFERIYNIPRPGTDRLVSTTSMLYGNLGPGNTFRLNRSIRSLDDSMTFMVEADGTVASQSGNTLTVQGELGNTNLPIYVIPDGSNVAFEDPASGTILGSAATVSHSGPASIAANSPVTFTFNQDLPAGLVGSIMYSTDASQRGGGTIVEQSEVEYGTNCCNGMSVWGLMNSNFQGNYIRNAAFAGMCFIHDFFFADNDWIVPPSANVTVSNVVIDGANAIPAPINCALGAVETFGLNPSYTQMTASPFQELTFTKNFIANAPRSAIWIGNETLGSVTGNYFLDPNLNPQTSGLSASEAEEALFPVVTDTSVNLPAINNTVDQTSARMWVTDMQYNELAAYAPGSVYQLNAYNLGTLAKPAITLTDSGGNVLPVTIQSTTTHAIDVLIPATAALGGAYFTLTSGTAKYFGTLFLDSQDNIPALNGCTFEFSPSSTTIPASGTVSILIVTQAGCSYTIADFGPGVTVSGPGPGPAPGTAIGTGTAVTTITASATTTVSIAGQTIALTLPAVIQAVEDVFNYTAGIAPGAWVAIGGTGLASGAPVSFAYTGTETLPTISNGTTVLFNGTPGALLYVSPTLVNALVPASIAPGPVEVVVQNNGATSASFMVTAAAALPAIYAIPNSSGSAFYVTAALAGTGYLVGNSAVDTRVLRAAEPGDEIDFYVIGLGATADPTQFNTTTNFAGAAPIAAPLTLTVAGENATVIFAGLVSPGLYLVRATLPSDLKPGAAPIQISIDGVQTSPTLMLQLQAAPQANLIQNGTFESPLGSYGPTGAAPTGNWALSANGNLGAAVKAQETSSAPVAGANSLQMTVTPASNPGNYCAVQLGQGGVPFHQGDVYSVQFWAKADSPGLLWMNVAQNGGNYPGYGLNGSVGLGPDWQQYLIYFQANATDPAGRFDFCMGDDSGNVWLSGVVLQDTNQ